MFPNKKVDCVWSSRFAYAIGLLATDGCLSKDERHIDFTSKDLELVQLFKNYLSVDNKIGRKARSTEKERRYFRVQFGDVNFYKFLLYIGLSPNKSNTIGPLQIPEKYFCDFLRGCIDGDGNIRTFKHPESINPQLRVRIFSASIKFLRWIRNKTTKYGMRGFLMQVKRAYVLEYAMADSINLLNRVYYKNSLPALTRKFLIAKPFLRTGNTPRWRNWKTH